MRIDTVRHDFLATSYGKSQSADTSAQPAQPLHAVQRDKGGTPKPHTLVDKNMERNDYPVAFGLFYAVVCRRRVNCGTIFAIKKHIEHIYI